MTCQDPNSQSYLNWITVKLNKEEFCIYKSLYYIECVGQKRNLGKRSCNLIQQQIYIFLVTLKTKNNLEILFFTLLVMVFSPGTRTPWEILCYPPSTPSCPEFKLFLLAVTYKSLPITALLTSAVHSRPILIIDCFSLGLSKNSRPINA